MDHSHPHMLNKLVEYELGQLAGADRAAVDRALEASPELRQQQAMLHDALHSLDQWEVPAAPSYLVNRVLSATVQAEPAAKLASSTLPAGPDGTMSTGPVLTVRELVAIAACITVFVGIFVPAGVKARNLAWRAQCVQSLQMMSQGLGMYAHSYGSRLPYAGRTVNSASMLYWAPGPRGVKRVSNTRHAYLPVKLGMIASPEVFVCPSRRDGHVMVAENYAEFDDVAEAANFTYAYQHTGATEIPAWGVNPRMAIMADANPLLSPGAAHRISPYECDVNSSDHEREDGQNVLYVDGAVRWGRSPNVGVRQNNIWIPDKWDNPAALTSCAVPASATDSFLINRR